MTIAPLADLTLEQFLQLPEIEASPAWEFIEGQPLQKPMPTLYHSKLQKRLTTVIDAAAPGRYEAFPELRCILDQSSVVPDIAVVRAERIPTENTALQGAPDWTIEILSPDQSQTRVTGNILLCIRQGCQLGWLLDPREESILVYQPDRLPDLLRQSDRLPTLPEIELELTVEQIFSWVTAIQS